MNANFVQPETAADPTMPLFWARRVSVTNSSCKSFFSTTYAISSVFSRSTINKVQLKTDQKFNQTSPKLNTKNQNVHFTLDQTFGFPDNIPSKLRHIFCKKLYEIKFSTQTNEKHPFYESPSNIKRNHSEYIMDALPKFEKTVWAVDNKHSHCFVNVFCFSNDKAMDIIEVIALR